MVVIGEIEVFAVKKIIGILGHKSHQTYQG
jgi:hypothetical protein